MLERRVERSSHFIRDGHADRAIDYRSQRFEEIARDVDLVLDPRGRASPAGTDADLRKNETQYLHTSHGFTPTSR
jgi:NADPH:quinone reductase-like Zn-dependent oxidoreductase